MINIDELKFDEKGLIPAVVVDAHSKKVLTVAYMNKESLKISMEKETKIMKKTLKIEGMMCGHCEMHVKKALEAIDGVKNAEVSHTNGTAVVTPEKEIPDDVLKKAVADQGYQVTDIQ